MLLIILITFINLSLTDTVKFTVRDVKVTVNLVLKVTVKNNSNSWCEGYIIR